MTRNGITMNLLKTISVYAMIANVLINVFLVLEK